MTLRTDYWGTVTVTELLGMDRAPRLRRHRPEEFYVVIPVHEPAVGWRSLGLDWSTDAAPGDWVRRWRPVVDFWEDDARRTPEGILVGVLGWGQIPDPDRFLVLWFR